MVVDDDRVECEISLLAKDTSNRISYRLFPIPDRHDDARLHWKTFARRRDSLETRIEECADPFQMRCRNLFHLDLIVSIPWIDIVELLLTGGPRVSLAR